MPTPGSQSFWITIAVVALVILRFLARELRDRQMRLGAIFTYPAIFGALSIFLIWATYSQAPYLAPSLAIAVVAAVPVGAALGFAIMHFTTVRPSGVPGTVIVRGSWITVAIWVGALVLRLIARYIVGTTATAAEYLMLNASLVVLLGAAMTVTRLKILQIGRSLPPAAAT